MRQVIKDLTPSRYRYQLQSVYYLMRSLLYAGDQVLCPCCCGSFRSFLPFGVQLRPGAQCPRCGALERHRMLAHYLRERTRFFVDHLSVLDIAPELALYQVFSKQSNLDYVTADLQSPLAEVKLDITQMPFPFNAFDVVLCMHVLEHIPEDRRAMREMFRMLKPGGWGIIQVPVDPERSCTFEDPAIVDSKEREAAFGQADHVRVYGRDYVERLADVGFSVEAIPYVKELSEEDIRRYGLTADNDEYIYLCRK